MASTTSRPKYHISTAWPEGLAGRDAVIVDLETTGLSAQHERILEIAAIRLHDGVVEQQWHTLINPSRPVPPMITALTGITTGMAASAPSFAEVAPRLRAFVGDAVLVAHNAAFDVGFLRRELERVDPDVPFSPDVLCTVKLSRRLLPGLPSHALPALIQALDLPIRRQHRALPDALATADLLCNLIERARSEGIENWVALRALANGPRKKRALGLYERDRAKELPTGPGVYLLKDGDENIFYIGKSVNVRRRVQDHVRGGSPGQPSLRRQLKRLANVEVIPTASELEALVLESRLIKRYLPVANQQLRDENHYPFIRVDVRSPYPRLELTRTPAADKALYFGPFRSARMVGAVVEYVRSSLGIRDCRRPSLPDGQPCLLLHLHKCLGPCVSAVSDQEYNAAVQKAISLLSGEWGEIVDGLEARMTELAEREQFEEAAELRDLLAQIRSIATTQNRIRTLPDFHAVIGLRLTPATAQVLFIRAGRLAEQIIVNWPGDRSRLAAQFHQVYRQNDERAIDNESLDEAWILASWIRQHDDDTTTVIELELDDLAGGLSLLRDRIDGLLDAASPGLDTARAHMVG